MRSSNTPFLTGRLYDHFGWDFNADMKKRMEDFMKNSPRDKHGTHRYTPGMLNLKPEQVRQGFAHYMERYELG
jgi:hypothetical protein